MMCSTVNPRKAFNPSSASHSNALLPKRGTYSNEGSIVLLTFLVNNVLIPSTFGTKRVKIQSLKNTTTNSQRNTPTKNYMLNEVNKYDDHKIAAATTNSVNHAV